MTIQDAMADVFLRAILANPEKFPKDLRAFALAHQRMWAHDWDALDTDGGKLRYDTVTFMMFKQSLSASVQDLPALMEDEK